MAKWSMSDWVRQWGNLENEIAQYLRRTRQICWTHERLVALGFHNYIYSSWMDYSECAGAKAILFFLLNWIFALTRFFFFPFCRWSKKFPWILWRITQTLPEICGGSHSFAGKRSICADNHWFDDKHSLVIMIWNEWWTSWKVVQVGREMLHNARRNCNSDKNKVEMM